MAIDYRRFSLGKTQISIERYTSTLVDGVWQRVLDSTLTDWASVQPYNTVDPADRFEPQAGIWIEERYVMYIGQVVYPYDSESSNPTSDIIIADGVKYQPIRVQKWLHLNHEHYKVVLKLYDGD